MGGKDRTQPPESTTKPEGCLTVWAGGLPGETTEEEVKEYFGTCGEITSIRLDESKRSGTKFCHVEYVDTESVDKAVKLSGEKFNGAKIRVDFASDRKADGATPVFAKNKGAPPGWPEGAPPP